MHNHLNLSPQRTPLGTLAPALKKALKDIRFTSAGIASFLGPDAYAAIFRGEPHAVAFSLRGREVKPLAVAIKLFLLHYPLPRSTVEEALGSHVVSEALLCGLLGDECSTPKEVGEPATSSDDVTATTMIKSLYDVRPHVIDGSDRLVFSDRDASMIANHVPDSDHVLGVGAASLSLLSTTPTTPAASVLDLGTGSGVQSLGQLNCAESIVATDVHPRALDLAEATLAGENGAHVDLRQGSWFEPVSGETFDRIVSNPPFVVGLPEVGHVYRDSGLDLDGATQLVVGEVRDHLNEGGTAHLLGAWIHTEDGQTWQQRVASWFPSHGVSAWILQRDVADPALYVGTWLKDESIDPRTEQSRLRTMAWLEHFANNGVRGIGFGYIAMKALPQDAPSEIMAEELSGQVSGTLSIEIDEYFARTDWLREQTPVSILSSTFALRPQVAQEKISVTNMELGMGFEDFAVRLTRTEGPCFSHDVDEHIAAIVAGLHPQGMNLEEVVELYAYSRGLDPEPLAEAIVSPIVDLIRHGIVLPAQLLDGE